MFRSLGNVHVVNVMESFFNVFKVVLWVNHISFTFWGEVVVNILGSVLELLFVEVSSHAIPFVSNDGFGNWDVLEITGGGSVHTKVWYWIVLWPVLWFVWFWVEILFTSSWWADWIRLKLDEAVLVTELGFGVFKVILGVNNLVVKFWSEVVVDVLGFVVELLLVLISSHGGPSLSDDFLGNWDVFEITSGGSVHTEVWNTIVLWPVLWFVWLWEEILGAAWWVADWVWSNIGLGLESIMGQWAGVGVSKSVFSIDKVGLWDNNVVVKFWSEVVVNILGFVVELFLVLLSSHGGPSLSNNSFSNWDIGKISGGGSIHTKVWYGIVLWIILWFISLWEEILSASRWIADWIRLGLDSGVVMWVVHFWI